MNCIRTSPLLYHEHSRTFFVFVKKKQLEMVCKGVFANWPLEIPICEHCVPTCIRDFTLTFKYTFFYYKLLFYFHLLTQFTPLTKENCRENKTKNLEISTKTLYGEFQLTGCCKLDDINRVSLVLNLFDHKIQPER